MGEDYFGFLRPRSQTRITTVWGNALVDVLNMLYGRSLLGEFTNLRANYGYISEALYVAGKPVIKDGDPITVSDLGYDAQVKITGAIEGASITGYMRDIHGKLVQLSIDEYGNVGVVVAKPVLTGAPGTPVLVEARGAERTYGEAAFASAKRFANVASGSSVEVLFLNPSTSNRRAVIAVIEVAATGVAAVDVYRNAAVTSPGTQAPRLNLNLSSTAASSANLYYGGSYSYSDEIKVLETLTPGGTAVRILGSAGEAGERVIIPPNSNLLIKLTNLSNTSADYSIKAVWWEE
ncbi:MAG: hypothetical protein QXZ31_09640 [Thermofilaceae archaeon]